jgi:hypothetical protein
MFELTESAANSMYNWANVLGVIGAVLVLLGAIGFFWGGNARDRFFDQRMSDNVRKTAEANESAARANEGLANANLEIARANERTAVAELELAKLQQKISKRSSSLTDEKLTQLVATLAKGPKNIVRVLCDPDPECVDLGEVLVSCLDSAGWEIRLFSVADQASGQHGIEIRYVEHFPGEPKLPGVDVILAGLNEAGLEGVEVKALPYLPFLIPGAVTIGIREGGPPQIQLFISPKRPAE